MAVCCPECRGRGTYQRIKKGGDPFKNRSKCAVCDGDGALYKSTGKVAGLKLNPLNSSFASINGFKTDKTTLLTLIDQATEKNNLQAVEFLTKYSRLNAVSTYLDTFVDGIKTWTRNTGTLHTNFNQCITATGRLSSSNINLQNMPKRGFPIRKAIVSRFKNGTIIEADYSGLELVVAGELSQDTQIIEDVKSGKDLHKQTACIINQCAVEDVTKSMRQSAKAFSFAPLYGGTGGGQKDHIKAYFTKFFNIYKGLKEYHRKLTNGVLENGIIQTPSGRQFYWPNAKRLGNGRITNHTQCVNYPVQSFATADLVPLSCVRALRKFRELKLQSKIILTVHDSIVVDSHADEREQVLKALRWAMVGVVDEATERWNYTFTLPLEIEISEGKNWLDQVELD
jgi:DNA polymerase-1